MVKMINRSNNPVEVYLFLKKKELNCWLITFWKEPFTICTLPPLLPCVSAGKESACNVGDLGSIPALGRSPREGKGYLLKYSWASFVTQLVKNLPATLGPGFNSWARKTP